MEGPGKHRTPKATKLLALVAAVVVAGGVALFTGSASAHNYGEHSASGGHNAGSGTKTTTTSKPAGNNQGTEHDHGSSTPPPPSPTPGAPSGAPNNGLDILGRDCSNSDLEPHRGFQEAPRCVSTEFGEVSAAANNPSLLITSAPNRVRVGQQFTIRVSTRNLVRDRFLGAAAGGYYLERSALTAQGIQRGHFHTACRMLASTGVAPDPAPVPAAFVATQDGGGGAAPDTVTVTIPGLPSAGIAQCAVWAGDGSHRIPMMERANETPAFDAVRITVR